jgi:glycosyltransferase involved in cell wall biosynthesis
VSLDVIGDGVGAGDNEALARDLGIAPRVRFHGGRSHDYVLAAMRQADVVVVPSLRAANGDEESSSLVTREALATGVPVVATQSGGIPESFPPGYRHELVPAGDAEALGSRILSALAERDGWPARADAGRRWIEARFDSKVLARRTATLYEEIVAAHPKMARTARSPLHAVSAAS